MIVINKKKFFIKAAQKWFADKISMSDSFKIVCYKQVDKNLKYKGFYKELPVYTLQIDLNEKEEEIFKKFKPTVRNEIRKIDRLDPEYNENTSVDDFVKIYNDFAGVKGLALLSNEKMNEYKDTLKVTSVTHENHILATHTYLLDRDKKIVRLLHSVSKRFSENFDRNLIAKFNKYLHYKDIIFFKNCGYEIYDWGGIAKNTDDQSLKGINKFKKSFGGVESEQKELQSLLYNLIYNVFKK